MVGGDFWFIPFLPYNFTGGLHSGMPDIISQKKAVFRQNCSHKYLSAIIALSATILIYISFFQRNFFSKTYAVYPLIEL